MAKAKKVPVAVEPEASFEDTFASLSSIASDLRSDDHEGDTQPPYIEEPLPDVEFMSPANIHGVGTDQEQVENEGRPFVDPVFADPSDDDLGIPDQTPPVPAPSDLATPVAAVSNFFITREEFEKDIAEFGAAAGKGRNSLPALALRTAEAAQYIEFDPEKEAGPLYAKYGMGAANNSSLEFTEGTSFDVQVSKFRAVLHASVLKNVNFYDVLTEAVDIIKELGHVDESPVKGSVYENIVKVSRAQRNKSKAKGAVAPFALTRDEIIGCITVLPKEKSDLDRLINLYRATVKAYDWAPQLSKEGIEEAANNLKDAIHAAGGVIPVK